MYDAATKVKVAEIDRSDLSQDFKKAGMVFKSMLPLIKAHNIPLTPDNYAIWYDYAAGNNAELSRHIDDIIQSGVGFSKTINQHVVAKFCSAEKSTRVLNQIKGELKLLVEKMLEKVQSLKQGSSHFSDVLDNCREVLTDDPNLETVIEVIAALIEESAKIEVANDALDSMLNSVNKEIDLLNINLEVGEEIKPADNNHEDSTKDPLTAAIEKYYAAYLLKKKIFSLVLVDIDDFDEFKQRYGRELADRVLCFLDSALKRWTKSGDMVLRYSNDKFCLLMPGTTYEGGVAAADRLRKRVSSKRLTIGAPNNKKSLGNITISAGIVVVGREDDEDGLLKRAIRALSLANEQGQNCVVGERQLFSR